MRYFGIVAGLTACIGIAGNLQADGNLEDRVLDFPADYRDAFTAYYSGDRYLNEDQTIRLYANDIALRAAQAGAELPDGSVLVAELFAAQTDSDGEILESAIGRRISGKMKAIAVMERRAGWDAQYPEDLKTGDWEFELFSTSGENLNRDTSGCRSCHNPLSDTQYMFSIEHLTAAK